MNTTALSFTEFSVQVSADRRRGSSQPEGLERRSSERRGAKDIPQRGSMAGRGSKWDLGPRVEWLTRRLRGLELSGQSQ